MKVLIVENENLAVKRLLKLLNEMKEPVEVAGITRSILETVNWLHANEPPDSILLDIELADGHSFEIFNRAEVKCAVIFISSSDESSLHAFPANKVDYLLKPLDKESLEKALTKCRDFNQVLYKVPNEPGRQIY